MDDAEHVALDLWWRAANYLSVGQIYLLANPLLREELLLEHVKPRLLGHWGTTPGLNFIYAHLNRAIRARDLNMIYVCGPGHGGPGMVANTWLEGSYSELVPNVGRDGAGMRTLFRQFSFPGGIPSHDAPNVPGSINEGGELGYSLLHATGAVFDTPGLVAACVVGDGEAETGPAAASWQATKFINPARDGAVLPILHLNGYKIAGPTVLARIPEPELLALFTGHGWAPVIVAGDDPAPMHHAMADALDGALDRIAAIQAAARAGDTARPAWPMLILRSPKGWTGPKSVDDKPVEGTWRAHQVPLDKLAEHPDRLAQLEAWMRSYRPEELFDADGTPVDTIIRQAPLGERRMGMNPHANGGLLLRDLVLPAYGDYALEVPRPGGVDGEATHALGEFIRDIIRANPQNFRLFGPDETASNKLEAVFEGTERASMATLLPTDEHVAPDGRVMEVLSEHLCQGWLEGYLLTGRHGLFSCYEAFIHIVGSMFNQHAKWLEATARIPWRRPIASFNYLLTSHVWRQDHNGFSHQDPGFIGHVANKKPGVVRVYLPPDANTLLSVADHCLRSRNYVNVIVAGKQHSPQWLGLGRRPSPLRRRHRPVGLGRQRPWPAARRGHGLRRRRADAGGHGRGRHPARTAAGTEAARGQRGGPDGPVAAIRTPARVGGRGVRQPVHADPAGHLRVPRLSLARAPADLRTRLHRPLPRARLPGGRHHHHAVRHDGAERPGPVHPGDGGHRPCAAGRRHRRTAGAALARQPVRPPRLCLRAWRGHAADTRLALAGLGGRLEGTQL